MRKMRDRDGDLWEEQPDGRFTLTHSTRYPTAVGSTHSLDNIARSHGPLPEAKPEQTPENLRDADGDIWTGRDDGKYVLTRWPDCASLGDAGPHTGMVEQFGRRTGFQPVDQTPEKIWDKVGDLWVRREDGKYVLTECTYDSAVGMVMSYSEIETFYAPFQGTGGNADFAAFLAELG